LRVLSAVLPLVVLAIALAVSYAVWERERREIERVLKDDFDQRVNDAVNVFRERVQGYEQVLRAVSGLFASSRKVERIDFQTFVRNLKMEIHPGLQGLGYSVLVPSGQLEMHLAAVRAEGFPTYALRPEGERPMYTSAIFFAPPSAAELSTIGSDYFAEPSRRAAMEQARDTAGVAVSNKIRLPGEDAREVQPGFRMVWPVYRNGAPLATLQERRENIVGWIFAAFSMEGLLGSTSGGERGGLALEVFDGSELQGEAASSSSSESVMVDRVGGESSLRLFSAARRVEAGGHTWMVTAQALPNFATPIAISQLQLVTIVGGASSMALALFTWALMRRRLRSLRNREELQLAKDRAEAANRAKSHFLAAASHDLRQPTQALGLFIATLRAMAKKPQLRGEEVGHIASRLQMAMEGLGRLLNGLLDVSRLEAGAVEVTLAPMPVQDVLTQVQNAFAGPAQAKGLKLKVVPSRLWVESDPVVLARIVSNLVANAVRYTEKGKVLVGCRRRGDRVEIQVMDTGIGIAEDQRARIFEEFYQVGEGARDGEQGLGLGLAIVQGSAGLLGGEVGVKSAVGRGSCFSVSVPQMEPVQVPETAAPAKPAERSRLVLVVDDDPAIRDAMRHLLEAWGHGVPTAASLDEAAKHARQQPDIDLLLTDYRLPQGATGIEAVDAVRAALGREIEAAIITGDTSPATLRSIQARGLRLLHKPLDEEELRELVNGRPSRGQSKDVC
jgi:signal transduction histidine kinase/CheY-like chemotaxis protein